MLEDELLLDVNNFNQSSKYEDFLALAKRIQNILLTEPGTNPNIPEFGVGLQMYNFEFLDNDTLSVIETNINEQVSKYVALNAPINIKLEIIKDNRGRNNVTGLINIYDPKFNQTLKNIIFSFGQQKKSTKIISKIIVT